MSKWSPGKSLRGISVFIPYLSQTLCKMAFLQRLLLLRQGIRPPSSMERSISRIKSGSISCFVPNPSHPGQAPKGLLKENMRGASSSMEIPQSMQENFSLNMSTSPPMTSTKTIPSPYCKAICTESLRRPARSGRTLMRSTTISILCFLFLSKFRASLTSWSSPSTRIRIKPSLPMVSITFLCSPLRPRTTGANT